MLDYSIHLRRFLLFVLLLCGASRAEKTLMWLTDWYQGNLDSVSLPSVYIPHYGDTGAAKDGFYFGTSDLALTRTTAYAPAIRVNLKVVNTGKPDSLKVPKELSRWWFSQPNFNTGNFRGGMVNVMVKFNSFNHTYQPGPPPRIQMDKGTGTGQSGQINQSSASVPGLIDKCIDSYNADSLWLYIPSADSVINPGYAGSSLTCLDHNPFFVKVGTIHVYNPWPGKSLYVQQGGSWRPLFPEPGRLGWQTTTIWADPRSDTAFKVRIASGKPGTISGGIQYMDASGLATNATGPAFDFSAFPRSEQWIMPPTSTGAKPNVTTAAPAIKTVLMIQRPNWSASAVRVLWKGNDARYIAGSTSYCNWYALPLYEGAVPDSIALQHPSADTLYGTTGIAQTPSPLSSYTGWIQLKGKIASGDTTWIVAPNIGGASISARPAAQLTTCDTKVLAFSAYDYADGLDNTSPYFYAPFAEAKSGVLYPSGSKKGQLTDNCPDAGGGASKGLVLPSLNAAGRPDWSGKTDCDIGDSLGGPQHWFDPLTIKGTRVNAFKCVPLSLKLDPLDGYYKYSSGAFFPLDQKTSVPYGPANGNNFHFAMHAKASFEYVRGLTFKFKGDDDVWIFINKRLALDLGGQHGEMPGEINLDKLGLIEGKSYQFDMFYSERHQTGSNIGIQTTMNLVPTIDVVFDTTASAGSIQDIKVKVVETSSDPSVCPEEGATTTQKTTPGRSYVYLLYPDGTQEEVDTLKYKDAGLSISNVFSRIEVDTVKLKKSGFFVQSGQYQVLISIGTESRTVPFSMVTKNISTVATIYDRDGDGRADSAFVNGDGASPAFKATFEAVIHWPKASGADDSVKITGTGLAVGASDSTLALTFTPREFRTACPSGGCAGDMGRAWGIDGDTIKNRILEIRDGIAPVADSAWLVYDSTGTGKDTLYVRASEILSRYAGTTILPAATSGWALLGNAATPRLLPDAGATSGNLVAIPLDPAANPINSGDSVRLGGYAADALNNAPGALSVWVPIASKPRVRAWMLDRDGDGTPDSVAITTKGSLAQVVSAKIHWKTADGVDTVLVLATPAGIDGGLKLPSNTTLQNATFCKGCTVEMSDASGAMPAITLIDSVAPVAVKATLITAGTGFPDTLEVVASEGFVVDGKDFVKLATDSAGAQVSIAAGDITSFTVVGRTLRMVVASGALDVTRDWLRLSAGLKDSSGATVGASSKWVPLKIRPCGSASLFDADGDGRADSVAFSVRGSIASLNVTEAVLSWKDVDGRTVTRTWSLEGNTSGSFGLHPADATLHFPFGATSCPGATCTIRLGDVEWPLIDKVAPIATGGRYAFGQGSAPDTLLVKLSETVTNRSTDPTWIEFGATGTLAGPVTHAAASVLASGDSVLLIVPVAKAPGLLVNQVRVAAGTAAGELRDVNATVAGSTSPWAPLAYGVAPLAVSVKDPSGQGSPDQVGIRTVRTVPVAALALDSVKLIWDNAEGTTLELRSLPLTGALLDTATQSWSLTLPQPLPLGATGCTLSSCGALGFNASGSAPALLIDSAAPVALSARLGYSKPEVAQDTLEIHLSEAWTNGNPASISLDQVLALVGTTAQPKTLVNYLGWNLSTDGKTLTLILDTAKSTQLGSGDSAWLSSILQDAWANHPGANTRRVPLAIGLRPLQLKIGTWPPVRKNEGENAWKAPIEGTPQFEILVRPQGTNAPWQTVVNGAFGGAPVNDTSHLTGMLLTLNRPLSGVLYVYDNIGVAVGRIDLKDLSKAWNTDSTSKDQVREVWITWNGTNQKNAFAASGVYLLRLVALVEVDKNKVEVHNLVKKVGWKHK